MNVKYFVYISWFCCWFLMRVLPQVVVEHHNGKNEQPPFFLQELQDLTVLDGDEVTLSVKLSGK